MKRERYGISYAFWVVLRSINFVFCFVFGDYDR